MNIKDMKQQKYFYHNRCNIYYFRRIKIITCYYKKD